MDVPSGPEWGFAPIPPALVAVVRERVPELVGAVIAAVGSESPAYGAVLGGPEGTGIRLGIEQAVVAFLDGAQRGEHPAAGAGELWRRLGESEYQAGRELEPLRSAFRTGTRALWREAAHVAAGVGVASTESVMALAEAIFVYTDELGADVVEGYLRARSDEAGELERRRRRVAALLVDPAGVDADALARAAQLARWTLPRQLGVLALGGVSPARGAVPGGGGHGEAAPGEAPRDDVAPALALIARHLDADVLVGADADGVYLVVPDPEGPGRVERLRRAMAGRDGALGPTVGVRGGARSLDWARRLLDLAGRGVLGPGSAETDVPAVADHLAELIVLGDAELGTALLSARLGALEEMDGADSARLADTLEAWLDHQRHVPSVARQLQVHPQTVRHRVRRLRDYLGSALDSPEGRFELVLALRIRRARRSAAST